MATPGDGTKAEAFKARIDEMERSWESREREKAARSGSSSPSRRDNTSASPNVQGSPLRSMLDNAVSTLHESTRLLLEKEMRDLRESVKADELLRKQRQDLKDEVRNLRTRLGEARNSLGGSRGSRRSNTPDEARNLATSMAIDEVETLKKQLASEREGRQELEAVKEKLRNEVNDLQQLLITAVGRSEKAYQTNRDLEDEITQLSKNHEPSGSVAKLDLQLQAERESRDRLDKVKRKLEEEVVNLTQQLRLKSKAAEAAERDTMQAEAQITKWKDTVNNLEKQIRSQKAEIADLRAQLSHSGGRSGSPGKRLSSGAGDSLASQLESSVKGVENELEALSASFSSSNLRSSPQVKRPTSQSPKSSPRGARKHSEVDTPIFHVYDSKQDLFKPESPRTSIDLRPQLSPRSSSVDSFSREGSKEPSRSPPAHGGLTKTRSTYDVWNEQTQRWEAKEV